MALLAPLRDLLPRLAAIHREAACIINLLDSGPDLLLRTDADLNPADRRLLAAFGAAQGIPRIAWARGTGETEMAAQLGPVRIILGGVEVAPPPGAFLQATATGASDIAAAPPMRVRRVEIILLFSLQRTVPGMVFVFPEWSECVPYDANPGASSSRVAGPKACQT